FLFLSLRLRRLLLLLRLRIEWLIRTRNLRDNGMCRRWQAGSGPASNSLRRGDRGTGRGETAEVGGAGRERPAQPLCAGQQVVRDRPDPPGPGRGGGPPALR